MNIRKHAKPDHPINELLANRWSPYGFSDRSVKRQDLQSLFEAVRWSASSYNEQPWRYIVATRDDPEQFARVLACLVEPNQAWAGAAAVLAIGCVSLNFTHSGKPNSVAVHDLGSRPATSAPKPPPADCRSIRWPASSPTRPAKHSTFRSNSSPSPPSPLDTPPTLRRSPNNFASATSRPEAEDHCPSLSLETFGENPRRRLNDQIALSPLFLFARLTGRAHLVASLMHT